MKRIAKVLVCLAPLVALALSCSDDGEESSAPSSDCPQGETSCGGECVDTDTDSLHCGACDNACGVGQVCSGGACACQDGLEACGEACVDLDSSGAHCGACDNACPSDQVCSGGTCADECASGETQCGQDCVDTDSSAAHCGACDNACPAGQACESGACACDDPSLTACGDRCVDLDSDPDHCGACDAPCETGETCEDGVCESSGTGGSGGGTGGSSGSAGAGGTGASGGASGTGGDAGSAGAAGSGGAPPDTCDVPATPADTSGSTVVGDGTPGSCTEAAFDAALASGDVITFDCGAAPHTITFTSEKLIQKDVVIDGGGLVTLGGGGTTRILKVDSTFDKATPSLTVQHLGFVEGYTGDLPGTETSSGGAAIFRMGGSLTVVDCEFRDNEGPETGQDVAGGAVYSIGVGETIIVGSTFENNRCSSGGAIGNLHNPLQLVNSTIVGNAATGNGGNPGNGGNGGGVYMDGVDQSLSVCGTTISGNTGNARGGGLFRVSNNGIGPTTFDRVTVADNSIPDNGDSQAGGLYLQGLQLTITGSTVSGNVANSAGGLFIWNNGGSATVSMTNVTIADNTARRSLGGGLSADGSVPGTLLNVSFVRNHTEGAQAFAAAIAGGDALSLQNCLIADHTKVFQWENLSCNRTHTSGGGNVQWPDQNSSGQSELPCADAIDFVDPEVGALQDNGGPTQTILPAASSVIGSASGCPAWDQRGEPRDPGACTPGAVEP